jgi:hypothetical protein
MNFSRRTLSLVTIVLIFGALAVGVWWRLGGFTGEDEASQAGEGTEAAQVDLP